ncbi:MAG: CDP-alcohol phosphatidyltransferase family protein [Ignavibacteriaceae bacterium]|nr:CDP-alcohol phosphatidyltransferase family protein [Ignavibacteriaceae bacterium]
MWLNRSDIADTFKSKYTEEFLDVIFYRPVGYIIARVSKAIGLTPNAVTIISIFFGVAAGHLFWYSDFKLNLIGVLMLIFAEALDSADGQLARLTGSNSKFGRFLDGFSENLWFLSIYLHLFFRLIRDGYSPYIIILIVIAGISHSFQSAIADYYRNVFTYMVQRKGISEIENSDKLKQEYSLLNWRNNFGRKLYMRLYINYTIQQEVISSQAFSLINYCELNFSSGIPNDIVTMFKNWCSRLIKYYNILTSNTRMIVLFYAALADNIMIYILFEIVCLNILLLYVVFQHEAACRLALQEARNYTIGRSL